MPSGQILNRFRIHVSFASFLILAEHIENANFIDCQTVSCTAKNAANATRLIKEFHHAWNHFVFLFSVTKTPKATESPTVCTLFRVNCNLYVLKNRIVLKFTVFSTFYKNHLLAYLRSKSKETLNFDIQVSCIFQIIYRMIVSASKINNLHTINWSDVPIFRLFNVKYNTFR